MARLSLSVVDKCAAVDVPGDLGQNHNEKEKKVDFCLSKRGVWGFGPDEDQDKLAEDMCALNISIPTQPPT